MKAMILAAGRGTRLRPLTDDTPKPLLKIDSFSLIEHLLFNLGRHEFNEVIVNVAHLGDQIVSTLGEGKRYGVKITYSYEPPGGLETGGGILKAMPLLAPDPFLVVSGDIWTDYPFGTLKEKPLEGLAHLVMVNNYAGEGDFCLSDNLLHPHQGNKLTFGNIGVYHPELFADYPPGFLKLGAILREAIQHQKVTAEHFEGQWENVGTMEALATLRERLNGAER
jgi:MurNAc alpha-1-phosphate uridylyltransferase